MTVRAAKTLPAHTESVPQAVALTVEAAESRKARDVLVLDLRALTDIADYFVICTADANTHARAIVEAVSEALHPLDRRPWHIEGEQALTWVLVDFVDVVVHVFREDARRFYALEEMWADAPRVSLVGSPHDEPTQAARSRRR